MPGGKYLFCLKPLGVYFKRKENDAEKKAKLTSENWSCLNVNKIWMNISEWTVCVTVCVSTLDTRSCSYCMYISIGFAVVVFDDDDDDVDGAGGGSGGNAIENNCSGSGLNVIDKMPSFGSRRCEQSRDGKLPEWRRANVECSVCSFIFLSRSLWYSLFPLFFVQLLRLKRVRLMDLSLSPIKKKLQRFRCLGKSQQ